jgi:hypothetical protein
MYKTPHENLLKVQGRRQKKICCSVATLRTRLWLEAIFRDNKISRKEFEILISNDMEPSGQVLKWLKGRNSVTRLKVNSVAKLLPDSNQVYLLPLFYLLENKPISKNQLQRYMTGHINKDDQLFFWKLPDTYNGMPDGLPIQVIFENNLDMLYQRGGIFGFIAIMYVMRKAEAERDADLHLEAVKFAYKSFPSFARHPHFKKRWREILSALIGVHSRVTTSILQVLPDDKELETQINTKVFTTYREHRPRHHITGRFIDNNDPFHVAQFRGF